MREHEQRPPQQVPLLHRATPSQGPAAVLRLQRSAGNAAVSKVLSRDAVDAAPAPASAAPATSRVAGLAQQAGGPAGLRAMLASAPGLVKEIAAFFAAGNEDTTLNSLMGEAFSPAAAAAPAQPTADPASDPAAQDGAAPAGEGAPEKAPKDPTLPLPANVTGTKTLLKGQLTWTLQAIDHSDARVDVDFLPDATKVDAKNVSFGQTVINKIGADLAYAGGTEANPAANKAKFQPFEDPTSKHRIDHLVDTENDPFYGAQWDQTTKTWVNEPGGLTGSSSTKTGRSTKASMNDSPGAPSPRTGKGDSALEFETVPMILETREPLGALLWGFKIEDKENAPIELTGAKDADATDTPSAAWTATMDQFYAAKYAEILDDFPIGKADLSDAHKTQLDNVVTKMTANAVLRAELGGAADLTGSAAVNQALSLKRATAARDYLVSKGIDAARLDLQSYGADWARVETTVGANEGKNRRVQVWVH